MNVGALILTVCGAIMGGLFGTWLGHFGGVLFIVIFGVGSAVICGLIGYGAWAMCAVSASADARMGQK